MSTTQIQITASWYPKTCYLPAVSISRTVPKESIFMHQLQRFVI